MSDKLKRVIKRYRMAIHTLIIHPNTHGYARGRLQNERKHVLRLLKAGADDDERSADAPTVTYPEAVQEFGAASAGLLDYLLKQNLACEELQETLCRIAEAEIFYIRRPRETYHTECTVFRILTKGIADEMLARPESLPKSAKAIKGGSR